MSEPIGISVVVPSFNQGLFIAETLDSLLEQGYPRLQILVMDGGSTDNTLEILRRYEAQIEWESKRDHGQSDAIAKGFARAVNPWLAWLNSDDIHCNSALWQVARAVERSPDADVVVGHGHYMDADGGNAKPYPTIEVGSKVDVGRELFEKGYVAQPSVFFRKSAYEAVGGIDRNL